MKSIKDAYKELKGDLKNSFAHQPTDRYLYVGKCDKPEYMTLMNRDCSYQYICTVEEFNNYKTESSSVWLREPEKPVYTQAMADANELPSVGMECLLMDGVMSNKCVPATILYVSKYVCVYREEGGEDE